MLECGKEIVTTFFFFLGILKGKIEVLPRHCSNWRGTNYRQLPIVWKRTRLELVLLFWVNIELRCSAQKMEGECRREKEEFPFMLTMAKRLKCDLLIQLLNVASHTATTMTTLSSFGAARCHVQLFRKIPGTYTRT